MTKAKRVGIGLKVQDIREVFRAMMVKTEEGMKEDTDRGSKRKKLEEDEEERRRTDDTYEGNKRKKIEKEDKRISKAGNNEDDMTRDKRRKKEENRRKKDRDRSKGIDKLKIEYDQERETEGDETWIFWNTPGNRNGLVTNNCNLGTSNPYEWIRKTKPTVEQREGGKTGKKQKGGKTGITRGAT